MFFSHLLKAAFVPPACMYAARTSSVVGVFVRDMSSFLLLTLCRSRIPSSIFRRGGSGDVGDDGGGGHLVSLCVVGAADTCTLRYSITKPLGLVMVKVSP